MNYASPLYHHHHQAPSPQGNYPHHHHYPHPHHQPHHQHFHPPRHQQAYHPYKPRSYQPAPRRSPSPQRALKRNTALLPPIDTLTSSRLAEGPPPLGRHSRNVKTVDGRPRHSRHSSDLVRYQYASRESSPNHPYPSPESVGRFSDRLYIKQEPRDYHPYSPVDRKYYIDDDLPLTPISSKFDSPTMAPTGDEMNIDPALAEVRSSVDAPEIRLQPETLAAVAPALEAHVPAPPVDSLAPPDDEATIKKDLPFSRSPELRVSHKLAERKRRKEMRDLFDELREALPADRGMKASKWEILSKAVDYIAHLKKQIQEHQQTNELLYRDLAMLRGENPATSATWSSSSLSHIAALQYAAAHTGTTTPAAAPAAIAATAPATPAPAPAPIAAPTALETTAVAAAAAAAAVAAAAASAGSPAPAAATPIPPAPAKSS